jgi:CheY-like chemotaxis protein/anti-sigma regulatory factor (Ser/Thr protein kinase)
MANDAHVPKVLVVDDSPDQARLVAFLLEKQGMIIEIAENGREALDIISGTPLDLIVTDLQMPEMDGLDLIEAVAAKDPCLPIVLVTAFGSEEIAVEALKRGATSYSPKRRLHDELVDTVQSLLAVDEAKRERACVLKLLVESHFAFRLENDTGLVAPLVSYMEEILAARFGREEDGPVFRVGVALSEALLNAIYHGNLEVDPELREQDPQEYRKALREQARLAPYRDRRIDVHVEMADAEVRFTVRDEGPGFDYSKRPDPTDPENILKLSGRGLFLIHSFMDRVSHNETGNEITMVKEFVATPQTSS